MGLPQHRAGNDEDAGADHRADDQQDQILQAERALEGCWICFLLRHATDES